MRKTNKKDTSDHKKKNENGKKPVLGKVKVRNLPSNIKSPELIEHFNSKDLQVQTAYVYPDNEAKGTNFSILMFPSEAEALRCISKAQVDPSIRVVGNKVVSLELMPSPAAAKSELKPAKKADANKDSNETELNPG